MILTTQEKEDLFNLLVAIDIKHTELALDLDEKYGFVEWDPDAYYTPLEARLNWLAEALGFDSHEIHEESYKRMKAIEDGSYEADCGGDFR